MSERLAAFGRLDGTHPLREAVPGGHIDYPARQRPDGALLLFNFRLAREIGLLPPDHPERMDPALEEAIGRTFNLQIVNEHDQAEDPGSVARAGPRRYMATRYLQLQHPSRRGTTSGDGRSVWNGLLRTPRGSWDVSSCGTGATRLSPGSVAAGRPIRTGDETVPYGSGLASLCDLVCGALMSEAFHRRGIRTERILAVIDHGDGNGTAVRAAPGLLRPAHVFLWLKQGDLARLRAVFNYHLAREEADGRLPQRTGNARLEGFLHRFADRFAETAARFESEYIFCWLDWDGDNILMDGGIIDYGSVRQFGLYHHGYRYDDSGRLSTTIAEQRHKARHIVQTMAQAVDFAQSGRRRPLRSFRDSPATATFDAALASWHARLLLGRIGLSESQARWLMTDPKGERHLSSFASDFRHFERCRSRLGPYRVADGITWDAIFCMRDLLRELPQRIAEAGELLPPETVIGIMRSRYASDRDARLYPARRARIRRLQRAYLGLVGRLATAESVSPDIMLARIARRSATVNPPDRATGDGALLAARHLIDNAPALTLDERCLLLQRLAGSLAGAAPAPKPPVPPASRWLHRLMRKTISLHSQSL